MLIPEQEEEVFESEDTISTEDESQGSEEHASESEEQETDSSESTPAKEEQETEEEAFEVIYDQKPVKIPKSQWKDLLQRGLNHERMTGKLTDYETKIEKISKLTGMDVDAVIAHLEEQQQAQAVSEYADTHGISEDEAKREFEREARLKAVEERETRRDFAAAAEAEMVSLKEKPFFSDLEADIVAFVKGSMQPGKQPIMPATVYKYFIGERFEELSAKDRSKTVKSTVADMHDRAKRGVVKSDSSGGDDDVDTAGINTELADVFGNSPKEIAKYVHKKLKRK